MNCILLCLANLYVETGIGYIHDLGPIPAQYSYRKYDYNQTKNPRAVIAIGHEWQISRKATLNMEIRHESWVATKADTGENGAWLSLRVMPWAK